MITATVCIPHVNTPWYLDGCLKCIAAHQHPELALDLIVIDQSDERYMKQACAASMNGRATYLSTTRVDAGYPIDVALKMAKGEYFCSLDCDAFPMHKNWLWLPIQCIKGGIAEWVGVDTGLSQAYSKKGKWVHLNNYFRASKTTDAKAASEAVGFMRYGNRGRIPFVPTDKTWESLGEPLDCDNGVIAQWWSKVRKLSLSPCRALGRTPEMGVYGMVIDDLVFHLVFGWGEEWIPNLEKTLGCDYLALREQMQRGFGTELITQLALKCSFNDDYSRTVDGVLVSSEVNSQIEEWKRV